jgi:hypothetical protein
MSTFGANQRRNKVRERKKKREMRVEGGYMG